MYSLSLSDEHLDFLVRHQVHDIKVDLHGSKSMNNKRPLYSFEISRLLSTPKEGEAL